MASYNELQFDWSMLCNETSWTRSDLQLAAELGRTLLERNKELESSLKHHQNIIEDQAQEITYLSKQVTALREVNDSRVRIYEQLDVSIQDLERANHRLAVENASEKKHNKTLCDRIENLESKIDELTKHLDETKKLLDFERRKNERLLSKQQEKTETTKIEPFSDSYGDSFIGNLKPSPNTTFNDKVNSSELNYSDEFTESTLNNLECSNGYFWNSLTPDYRKKSKGLTDDSDVVNNSSDEIKEKDETIRKKDNEIALMRKNFVIEQQKVAELEDQIINFYNENQKLQGRIAQINTNEEMKSVHEELSILEEVRQGQMCNRCLRNIDDKQSIADSSIMGGDDDEDRSIMDIINGTGNHDLRPTVQIKDGEKSDLHSMHVSSPNPYRELVEKYEALLEIQRPTLLRNRPQPINLLEELQTSGEFSSINTKFTDEESARSETNNKAESASSGFSDETSNKATQTDERAGHFLCAIDDGEDCKFSIYDNANPIDSRFRNRPEYRLLFKEIFAVLKKAAENKEDGDKLPLLDDTILPHISVKAPPVTPATEDLPDFCDDTQSIISSAVSEQSVAMSERITKTERKKIEKFKTNSEQENKPPRGQQVLEDGRVLTPLKRQPLEYLSIGVQLKKKSKKNRNRNLNLDRSDSPILPSPPRVFYSGSGKKRREMRPFNQIPENPRNSKLEWNGNSLTVYNRNMPSPTPGNMHKTNDFECSIEYKPSAASQDLHKLKKLELSYAEVLRRADQCNKQHHRRK